VDDLKQGCGAISVRKATRGAQRSQLRRVFGISVADLPITDGSVAWLEASTACATAPWKATEKGVC
jgi:hypothetical protein